MFACLVGLAVPFLPSAEVLNSRWYLGGSLFLSVLNAQFVIFYMCKHQLLDRQLTTALVPTVPSLCLLVQSATIAKVRETFWHPICPYGLHDR